MKKQTGKNNKIGWTEVGALIEAMRREFRPILEDIPSIKAKLDSTYEQAGKNTEQIELLRLLATRSSEEIKRIRDIVTKTSEEIELIREGLKSKVSRSEFELLEKKVDSLV